MGVDVSIVETADFQLNFQKKGEIQSVVANLILHYLFCLVICFSLVPGAGSCHLNLEGFFVFSFFPIFQNIDMYTP